ncbi:class I SAM-dependent methyltransferase [Desulfolutivibrio sulfoxidireducens]|uniref:class I SAM-dependent methyltransferase n=1 Tax=Desulfolutivibrio sulfoxidireducens TaxID=2773299 RepID=UPI00159E220E|nr:class I SAM-dependent methyltransferase [Desulfolutivibrio sulfoxidireducens]QLA20630.1 methyltransferase [Desulfolutivibrio sulfoxidireducens]
MTHQEKNLPADTCPLCGARDVPLCFERESGERYHQCGCGMVFLANGTPECHYPVDALSEKMRRCGFFWDYRGNKLRSIAQSHMRWVLSRLRGQELSHPPRALSVGCAYGHDLYELKKAGWRVLGVDHDASFAERARRQHGIEVKTAFFEALDLGEDFDLVILASVLPYLTDIRASLRRLEQLTRPGGCVFITTRDIDHCDVAEVLSYPMNVHARQYFTTAGLAALSQAHGFSPVACESFAVRHPFFTRILPRLREGRPKRLARGLANLQHAAANALGLDCYRPAQGGHANQVRFLARKT